MKSLEYQVQPVIRLLNQLVVEDYLSQGISVDPVQQPNDYSNF